VLSGNVGEKKRFNILPSYAFSGRTWWRRGSDQIRSTQTRIHLENGDISTDKVGVSVKRQTESKRA